MFRHRQCNSHLLVVQLTTRRGFLTRCKVQHKLQQNTPDMPQEGLLQTLQCLIWTRTVAQKQLQTQSIRSAGAGSCKLAATAAPSIVLHDKDGYMGVADAVLGG